MRQMKKKIIIAIIVTLLLTAAIAFAISHFVIKEKDAEILELQQQVVDTECLAFANDLKADSVITQSDLKTVQIKLTSLSAGTYKVNGNSIRHMILDSNDNLIESKAKDDLKLTKESLVGRVVKSNVSTNTLVMDSLLYAKNEEPTKDERIQEFNFIQIPSDVNVNDYIDVRIQFPAGEDYSVLIGKKVEKIAGENTIFLKLKEDEIMTMGSAVIEAYMQKGVKLYAIKYTDPATQLFNEEIVDYVAKYEYAVKKLMDEKIDLNLRKEVAKLLASDESYLTDGVELINENAVGVATVEVKSGDVLTKDGDVATEDSNVMIFIVENEDKELTVANASWEAVPQFLKDEVLNKNPKVSAIELADLEDEILAQYAGIDKAYVEEIKLADSKDDDEILSYYKVMRFQYRDEIIKTDPVKAEVLQVIRNNPNLLETIIAEFDETALLNTRIDEYQVLKAEYEAIKAKYDAADEYTKMMLVQELETAKQKMDAVANERTENVEEKLKAQISAQRAQRVEYLDSLING